MATVNKDFKIKQGLVVEGTTATVNGHQVLTETASDQYIIDLIGGETLVTSVNPDQLEVVGGELSVKDNVFDAAGAADTAETNAQTYTNNAVFGLASELYVDTARNQAIDHTNTELQSYTPTSSLDATVGGYGYLKSTDLTGYATETYADNAATAAENNAKAYADELINDASNASNEVWSAYKTNTEIGLAQSAAESYADTAIANLVDSAPATLDTLNELAAALQDNPDIITDLQDIAAGKQDTLIAGSNINITGSTISVTELDTDDVAEGVSRLYFTNTRAQDAIGAGTGLTKDGQGTELAINRQTVDTWYDAAGSAQTAEDNAKSYTDTEIGNLTTVDIPEGTPGGGLYFTDARAVTAIDSAITGGTQTNISVSYNATTSKFDFVAENGIADSDTDDLAEGTTHLYFTDQRVLDAVDNSTITPAAVEINNYRKEEATQQYVANASTVNVHGFSYPYEAVKYLVRVVGTVGGTKHSQITEILMTVDGNDNIAMTEYGNVHTSTNPLATFSAQWVPADGEFKLTATTSVAGCEIIAAATMLSWAD